MAANSLEIKLETLTPIWTGGANGKSEQLHLTGIMGSLRWWFEVLVRSVGGHVCDPGKRSCLYDPDTDGGLCDVCRVFGTTGWARRFRLSVIENKLQPRIPAGLSSQSSAGSRRDASQDLVFRLSRDHPANRDPKWYLKSSPLGGSLSLRIISTGALRKSNTTYFNPAIIGALIQFIADRASIGAKPQMGLGVVQLASRQSTQPLIDYLKQIVQEHKAKHDLNTNIDGELPCLQNMFFARVEADSSSVSATFDLKYDLRAMFREKFAGDDRMRHTVMGFVRGNNRDGSKISMSYPYDGGFIRIWGWIPKSACHKVSRNEILNKIYDFLAGTFGDEYFDIWQDFDPKKYNDVLVYLQDKLMVGAK